MVKLNNKRPSLDYLNRISLLIKSHQIISIFIFFFIIYNLNFRLLSSGDTAPASLIPFTILENHTPYLDSFIPYIEMRYENTYFLLNGNGHFVSLFPIVTPVLVTPLYIIPYLALKFYGTGISIYDPHLFLLISLMEKISASIVTSLACVFVFLSIRKMFNDKIAWLSTITFGLAINTWSTSSQNLWQHGMVELLLAVMIYLVLLIEEKENKRYIVLLGLLSGLFIFNRPPDSVLLIPIMVYTLFLKKKARVYYCFSMLIASVPFIYYNVHTFGNLFGGYSQNLETLTIGINTISNILGLLISPNRGLFIYSPVLILSLVGMYKLYTFKNRNIRIFLYLFFISFVLDLLVYASFDIHWWAGYCYGPRFLSGMAPIIVMYLAVFLHYVEVEPSANKKTILRSIFLILLAISFFVQVIGTFYYPSGDWNGNPDINTHSERLWKLADNQIMTTYKAGPWEPYFIHYKKYTQEDIIEDSVLVSGWEGIERIDDVPTRWMINNGTANVYFQQADDAMINFTVMPFNDLKHLQIKLNGNMVNEVYVDGLTKVSFNASFKQGKNQIVFYSPEGCKRPSDIPELKSVDHRCLSFQFKNLTIGNSDVVLFSSGD